MEVFSWNPRRTLLPGRVGRILPSFRRVNNFGDLLGPMIVERMLRRAGLAGVRADHELRLLTVGSVMHFASTGDVVWGTGVNGKVSHAAHEFQTLDVRAVRGPLTASFLAARGIQADVPFGDPALLLPELFPELRAAALNPGYAVTVVPNLNDRTATTGKWATDVLDPTSPVMDCLTRIVRSELVVGSSLHGVIVAEAFGIPARLVQPEREAPLKYEDYFRGTGRAVVEWAESVDQAVEMGGCEPLTGWRSEPLIEAFPYDLWDEPNDRDA